MDRKRSSNTFTRHKKAYIYVHNFSTPTFSSSGTYQSHHPDGCQAIGINSFINPRKAIGQDKIPPALIKMAVEPLSTTLSIAINNTFKHKIFPINAKVA